MDFKSYPGALNEIVSLRKLDTAIDAIGGVVNGWSHYAYAWARWLPSVGREVIAAQSRIAEAAGVLRMRQRSDINETWRVSVGGCVYDLAAPPVRVGGRDGFLDLIVKQAPVGNMDAPLSNIFEVALPVGASSVNAVFPAAFDSAPQGLYIQLVVPTGQGSFTVAVTNLTATGFTINLGAVVPASGYVVSVQAFRYQQTYAIDLIEGASSQAVLFASAFPSVPRGLKATLMPPLPDGYEFTTSLVVKSLTASGFTLEFGAVVPGPNYKALLQISL